MRITLDDLTVNFAHLDRDTLLAEWEWLIGPTKFPILLTASGDAFVEDAEDGSVHVLDTGAGELLVFARDVEEFRTLLANAQFVRDYLAVQMIAGLKQDGLLLGPGQVYSWKVPPVLGGDYTFENADVADISVHFSLTGQIHRQAKVLPFGTPITSVSVERRVA